MRSLLIVLAGACVSVGTSLAVWAGLHANEPAYCEAFQGGLISTNGSETAVNLAVAQLLDEARRPAPDPEQALEASAYHESAEAWFSKEDFSGLATERASRLVREQLGRDGLLMRIEVVRGVEMPTLVFVDHESAEATASLGKRLLHCLAVQGVRAR